MRKDNGKVTLKDIARETGLSVATVSRVLNQGDRFYSDDTERIVKEAAKRLNYQTNLLAKGLKTGNSFSIAFLVPQLDDFYNHVLQGVFDYVKERGYSVSALSSDYNGDQEDLNIQHIIGRQYDGVVVVTGFLREERNEHPGKVFGNIPLVMADCEKGGEEIASVSLNVQEACMSAVEHLISFGHRRIAYFSAPPRFDTLKRRYQGYLDALEKHGITYDPSIVFFDEALERTDYDEFYRLMKRILQNRNYTALFSMSDYAAVAAIRVVSEQGQRIPEELSIIGFDNIPFTQFTLPPITTVSQNSYQVGRQSAELLINLIQGRRLKSRRLNCELIKRGTVGYLLDNV